VPQLCGRNGPVLLALRVTAFFWHSRRLALSAPRRYQDITDPGYATISVKPYIPSGLNSAKATIINVRGKVESSWTKASDGSISLSLTVPAGATARLSVPAGNSQTVYEGGKAVSCGITGVVVAAD
jgi:hypothetical protein